MWPCSCPPSVRAISSREHRRAAEPAEARHPRGLGRIGDAEIGAEVIGVPQPTHVGNGPVHALRSHAQPPSGCPSEAHAPPALIGFPRLSCEVFVDHLWTTQWPNNGADQDFHTQTSEIHTIFEGTSEIQQLVISRAISGLRIE